MNETGEDYGIPRTNTDAPVGTSTRIVDLPPGEHEISCYPVDMTADPVERESAQLEVVDEDGIRVSDRLDCPELFSQINDYIAGARGTTSDPLQAAREAVQPYGLAPDDVFERVGCPEADTMRVRLVRAGELLAVVTGCPSLQE